MTESDISLKANIPNVLESSETITLQSKDGKGFGFELDGNAKEGFVINKVQGEQTLLASGQIHSGDMVSGIGIDLDNLNKEDLQKILSILSPYPIKVKIKKPMLDTGIALKKPKFDANVSDMNMKFESEIKEGWIDKHKPKIGFGGKSGQFDINVPYIEVANASLNVDAPSLDISGNKPELNVDAKVPDLDKKSSFHIKFPKFGGKKKKVPTATLR